MGWTKADDEKLRLLDYYGVTVTDMAKILGVTYNSVNSRLEKIGIKASTQIHNEGTFSEERLAREHLFTVYCQSKRGRQRGICSQGLWL